MFHGHILVYILSSKKNRNGLNGRHLYYGSNFPRATFFWKRWPFWQKNSEAKFFLSEFWYHICCFSKICYIHISFLKNLYERRHQRKIFRLDVGRLPKTLFFSLWSILSSRNFRLSKQNWFVCFFTYLLKWWFLVHSKGLMNANPKNVKPGKS